VGRGCAAREIGRDAGNRGDAEPAAADPDLVAVGLAFWDTVKDSDNPAMYVAYLERYADGAFAARAKVRLSELDTLSQAPVDSR